MDGLPKEQVRLVGCNWRGIIQGYGILWSLESWLEHFPMVWTLEEFEYIVAESLLCARH